MLALHNKIKVSCHATRLAQRAVSIRDERGIARTPRIARAASVSGPIAVLPRKKDKNGDQSNYNQHPVLAVES